MSGVQENLPFDAGDPKAVGQRIKDSKTATITKEAVISKFLSTPEGRKVLFDWIIAGDPFGTAFSKDAGLMAYNCGQQDIAKMIFADCNGASEELVLLMNKENNGAKT